jgi:branched-subunit amino acid aminotransferase/4-amino-4-deoxychorismate lyase
MDRQPQWTPRSTTATCISSILAKIEANAAGADDALMLDMRGFVAETNATHSIMEMTAFGEGTRGA